MTGLLVVGLGTALLLLASGARRTRSARVLGAGSAGAFRVPESVGLRAWRRWRHRPDPRAERELWPALVQQMAALLKSGIESAALWRELARAAPVSGTEGKVAADIETVLDQAAQRSALGLDPVQDLSPAALHSPLSRRIVHELGACWAVAAETGAPLATVLERFAGAVEDDLDAKAARDTALAGPRATARILSGLPVLGLGLGMLMGTDPVGGPPGPELGTPGSGRGCGTGSSRRLVDAAPGRPGRAGRSVVIPLVVLTGVGLLALGLRRAPRHRDPGTPRSAPDAAPRLSAAVRLELIGTMLDAGLSVAGAVQVLARCESALRDAGEGPDPLEEVGRRLGAGLAWDRCWEQALAGADPSERAALDSLQEALRFAVRTGAPGADLLRAQAARLRRVAHRQGEKAAAALGVRLVVPLGLCSLPSFVCLGVLPVLIGLVPALW